MTAIQTPQQEFQERAAEQASAWLTLPHLAGLQNLRETWARAQQRVSDSHAVQMKSIGGEATEPEMPGDIGISGDHSTTTTIHNHYSAAPSIMPTFLKKCLPLAATLALGGAAGVAAPLLLAWWNKPTPTTPPAATSQDWQLGIEVVNP